ncbi:uncharacterized protein K489DRAFT_308622, partial [Dissoconium aciculare CBS 342.82]|uniref:Uncharacterized protein n=1 Tax=Dissoconium aciculare CBS 342.82 TaxID=1314786 RepID=A0A6J3MCA0_9PEZI
SVWAAMNYKPPRGRCNHKSSLISSCTCLRFMLHPVKVRPRCAEQMAATSFECDGCGHHASFHSLENVAEDAILKKWSVEASREASQSSTSAVKKRRRL